MSVCIHTDTIIYLRVYTFTHTHKHTHLVLKHRSNLGGVRVLGDGRHCLLRNDERCACFIDKNAVCVRETE